VLNDIFSELPNRKPVEEVCVAYFKILSQHLLMET